METVNVSWVYHGKQCNMGVSFGKNPRLSHLLNFELVEFHGRVAVKKILVFGRIFWHKASILSIGVAALPGRKVCLEMRLKDHCSSGYPLGTYYVFGSLPGRYLCDLVQAS